MGSARWDDKVWEAYSAKKIKNTTRVDEIYKSKMMNIELDPKGVAIRESCDCDVNPESTPVIVALDVTGSMGRISDSMAREGLKTLATEIYNRKPITDPHIMFMGIGDVEMGDRAPLQVTQFEADIRIAEQLAKIYLENGGGGNRYESYALAWFFAANHTRIDSFEKRGKKGFLFTIGDELPTPYLRGCDIERVMGYKPQFDKISALELYTMASKQYEVFHIVVEQGNGCQSMGADKVIEAWREVIGQNVIRLSDYTKMAQVIVSTLQLMSGDMAAEEIVSSWDGTTGLVVLKAIKDLSSVKTNGGVVKF